MLQRIAAEKTVNVFDYVMSLRCDRNIMVQVEEQYVFIHEVLVEAIHAGYTEIRANELRAHVKRLMEVNANTGTSSMDFHQFCRFIWVMDSNMGSLQDFGKLPTPRTLPTTQR